MRACWYMDEEAETHDAGASYCIMHQQVGATGTDSSLTRYILLARGALRPALMRLRSAACQCFVRSISNPQHDKGAAPELRVRRAPDGDAQWPPSCRAFGFLLLLHGRSDVRRAFCCTTVLELQPDKAHKSSHVNASA